MIKRGKDVEPHGSGTTYWCVHIGGPVRYTDIERLAALCHRASDGYCVPEDLLRWTRWGGGDGKLSFQAEANAEALAALITLETFMAERGIEFECQAEANGRPEKRIFRRDHGLIAWADLGDPIVTQAELLAVLTRPAHLRTARELEEEIRRLLPPPGIAPLKPFTILEE